MSVTSEPSGAVCRLTRDGETVGVVNPTPNSVSVSRSTKDLSVRCERDGFQPGVQTVSPNFQAMTLGNLLIGGVVGVVVDAASGAISQYPTNVHVVLPPAQLAAPNRNEWFDGRRREIVAQYDERLAALRTACERPEAARNRQTQQACREAIDGAAAQREAELRTLEEQRNRPGA
jgi:hypothetical protein